MRSLAGAITRLEELCLSAGILGIAILTIANVLTRVLLSRSLAFAEEISQFLIVWVTFLGLGYAVGKGRHIRMTALYDQLPDRPRKAVRIFICASTAALLFLFAYLSAGYALGTVRTLGSVSPTLKVPLYLVYLAAPIGFSLAGIQYVLAVVKNVRHVGVHLSYEKRDEYDEDELPAEGL